MSNAKPAPSSGICRADGKIIEPCDTLKNSCEHGNPSGKKKGLFCWSLHKIDTCGEHRRLFGAKSGEHVGKGIIFNFCPFCGTDLIGAQDA